MATRIIKKNDRKSLFITLEGMEGSGKSSVIEYLKKYLKKKGLKIKEFREPGSTRVGEKIRDILLDNKNKKLSAHTELLLYLAARTQLIEEKLFTAFKTYDCIICDRFFDSTLVYQGYALGMGDIVNLSVSMFNLGVVPDLTIVLDANVKQALGRLKTRDRIESRKLAFHNKLKSGYKLLAKKNPKRIRILNSQKPLLQVYSDVEKVIDEFLCKKKIKK